MVEFATCGRVRETFTSFSTRMRCKFPQASYTFPHVAITSLFALSPNTHLYPTLNYLSPYQTALFYDYKLDRLVHALYYFILFSRFLFRSFLYRVLLYYFHLL